MKRKTRILAVIFGLLLYPTVSYAVVPTIDIKGTFASIKETIQTISTKVQTALQIKQLQETMSSVGTAIKGVTTYINNVKNNIEERLKKLEKYKKKYEEYKAEYEAYKKMYNDYKAEYEKYKAQVEDAVDKAKSTVSDVKNTVDTVKDVVQNADAIIDSQVNKVKDKVGLSSDSSSSSSSSDSSSSDSSSASSGSNYSSSSSSSDSSSSSGYSNANSGSNANYTSGSSSSSGSVSSGSGASYSGGTTGGSSGSGESGVSGGSINSAETGGASIQSGLVDSNVQTPSRTPMTQETALAEDAAASAVDADVSSLAVEGASADGSDQTQENTAQYGEESAVAGSAKIDADAEAKTAETEDKVEDAIAEDEPIGADVSVSTKEMTALPTNKSSVTPIPSASSGSSGKVELQESLLPEAASDENIKSDSQPTRQPFSLSYGYGHLSSSFALANASLEIPDLKTGDTPEDIMIVPKALTTACNNKGYKIDYKSVANREDEEFDKCLVAINAERKSSDVSQDMRESAAKIMNDAYADYLASSYLTALNVYNESLTFKKKKVAPILKSHASTIDDAWTYVQEMNELTGTRFNQWSFLVTRLILQEMFEPYATLGLTETETTAETATTTATATETTTE